MLSSRERLRTRDVEELMRGGKALRGRFLTAKILLSEDGTMRCAAAVPKSVRRKATDRNRLRRALYRALRLVPRRPCKVIFFVRSVPDLPLSPAFLEDATQMLASLRP